MVYPSYVDDYVLSYNMDYFEQNIFLFKIFHSSPKPIKGHVENRYTTYQCKKKIIYSHFDLASHSIYIILGVQ